MSSKRPAPAKPSPAKDEWQITDEWGIYDPAKAGMPALFARLGRPILRAAATSRRKERRRALRPERSTEGVGMALAEARRRAGLDLPADEHPLVGGNPARAMRIALKAQAAVNALGTPEAAPFVPPPAPPPPAPPPPAPPVAVAPVELVEAARPVAAPRKRTSRKVAAAPVETVSVEARVIVPETPAVVPAAVVAAPPQDTAPAAPKARARRAPAKSRAKTVAAPAPQVETAAAAPVAVESTPIAAARVVETPAPAPVIEAPPVRTGPPAPSPRRPRGPVPLAAWARAVADAPKPEPRRSDKRGFWRGVFRIPTEVALVEYAHGCRIHRLLVEAGDDHLPDFI